MATVWQHPRFDRRQALQAGAIGLLGLGTNHLTGLADGAVNGDRGKAPQRSVIYIFLSGGLGQHDSFDPKPDAPENVRGEFAPIATQTPGLLICEHLPRLAARSQMWSVVRSLTHKSNEHSEGHLLMLTGRSQLPPTFNASKPMPEDWPSIAAVAGAVTTAKNNLPPSIILPEKLIHRTGRVIPGQFAGHMGRQRDPWLIDAAPFNSVTYGAYPQYEFHHARGFENNKNLTFQAPSLSLPDTLTNPRVMSRLNLLETIDRQRRDWDRDVAANAFDRHRENAVSLLTDSRVRAAFDVTQASPEEQERYGRNSFGWSLLMARRLVEAGVTLVQVNLGNNESWDTHGNAFDNLKNYLMPPTDHAVAALLDDLSASGRLDDTLIVMAGEFGRTPKIFGLPSAYKKPGRDHWGAVQSVFLAGGGIQGGRVIGSTDKLGGYPLDRPQTPENLGATIYSSLGIPESVMWHDDLGRPHHVYHGTPIPGLA